MAVTFGTNRQMQLVHSCDSLTNVSGPQDGLEGFGYAIQGTDCIVVAIRKNESLAIGFTQESGNTITVPAGSQVIAWAASSVGQVATSQTMTITGSASSSAAQDISPFINGYFQPFCFNYNNYGNTLTSITWTWNASAATIKTADNIWMDAIYVGDGVDLTGTTTTDKLFFEGQNYDETSDTYNGVLTNKEGVVYSQGNVFISTTTGNSFGETLVFYQTVFGNNTYTLEGNGTAVFQGTNITTSGTITLDIDMSSMSNFSMLRGSITGATSVTFTTGQTITSAVFDTIGTVTTGGSSFNRNVISGVTTFNCSSAANALTLTDVSTIVLTAALTNSTITTSDVLDLSNASASATNCTFVGNGSTSPGNAVDYGTVTGGASAETATVINWQNFLDNGANNSVWVGNAQASTQGQQTNANAAVTINVAAGTYVKISVAVGYPIPTVQNTGTGWLEVSAGEVTLTLTNIKSGSDVVILQQGTTNKLVDEQDISGTSYPYVYTYSAGTFIDIAIYGTGYVPYFVRGYELGASSSNLPISQVIDRNYTP